MEQLEKVEDKVREILSSIPTTRSSDKLLIMIYMRDNHRINTFMDYVRNDECPSVESIRRCRQKIQAAGDFMSVSQVETARENNEEVYRAYAVGEQTTLF